MSTLLGAGGLAGKKVQSGQRLVIRIAEFAAGPESSSAKDSGRGERKVGRALLGSLMAGEGLLGRAFLVKLQVGGDGSSKARKPVRRGGRELGDRGTGDEQPRRQGSLITFLLRYKN